MDIFCPYVGLQPYTEMERRYFFGRERDQRVIISNLYASPLTVLYGSSGVGKSSVLLAGVVPELKQRPRTAVAVFRNWQDRSFLNGLKSACIQSVETLTSSLLTIPRTLPLDDILREAAVAFGGSILVLLDQFEEYFLYHGPMEVGNTFEAEFARAINREEVDAGFLLVLREDGLSKLDRFRSRIPNLLNNMVRLNHLDAVSAEAAIRGPLEVYKQEFSGAPAPAAIEDDLVSRILTEVRSGRISISQSSGAGQAKSAEDTTGIETPFLQLILTKLWTEEAQAESPILRLETFNRLGGAQMIAQTHLDRVMDGLEPHEQEVCSRFFDRLVTPSGTKIAQAESDLKEYAGNLTDCVPVVLQRLSDARVVRTLGALPDSRDITRYEIFHDILATAMLDWKRRYALRQEIVEKEQARTMEVAKEEAERARLKRLVNDRTRQLRWVIGALMVFTFGSIYAATVAWQEREEANKQKDLALSAQQDMHKAKELAEQRMNRIVTGIKYKQLALASDGGSLDNIPGLEPSGSEGDITFRATAKYQGYKQSDGKKVWRFTLGPQEPSGSELNKRIAFITYRMNHSTFKNSLLVAGPDRNFTASYLGWGCLVQVLAVIEYVDPDQPTRFVKVDMCGNIEWQE